MTPQTIQQLPIGRVFGNPAQPRKIFHPGKLEELAASIRANGLMQPITVVENGDNWLVVMGERRLRASKLAGAKKIPAIVRKKLTKKQVAEMALVENISREDLSIVEEARAYQVFLDKGYTVESLGVVLGLKQPWRIQERLNLLKLDPSLLEGVIKGAVSAAQAQEMSRLSTVGQFALWRAIQAGQCQTYGALRRLSCALFDCEHQLVFFKPEVTAEDVAALDRIDAFVTQAGRLVSLLTPEDIAAMVAVPKFNARSCADQIGMLEKLCRDLKENLLTNAARQDIKGEPKTVTAQLLPFDVEEKTAAPVGDRVLMVGHSTHSMTIFGEMLTAAGVRTIVDVRTRPQSRYCPQFNRAALEASLLAIGIGYQHVKELGGKDPLPMAELRRAVAALLPLAPGTCLMCSEGDFKDCHRHYLLAPFFLVLGIAVEQITPKGLLPDHGPSAQTLKRNRAGLPSA